VRFSLTLRDGIRFCRRKPLGAVSLVIVVLLVLVAALANVVAPYDPTAPHYAALLKGPSRQFLMGTDQMGRDLLSRIIFGSRISLYVGFVSVGLGVLHGAFWGALSGYVGGKVDQVVQRVMDGLMAIPFLVLAMTIVAVLGPSLRNVILALAIVFTPTTNRIVRASVLAARENVYVDAAMAIGCRNGRILIRHVLPNVFAPILVVATVYLGNAIVIEASLSFLGMGSPPPDASWGAILSTEGRQFLERAPWIAIFPGAAISIVVLSFNLLGDALRDVLDPRLRTQ
jgi:peptide/nickel transport system permease protein